MDTHQHEGTPHGPEAPMPCRALFERLSEYVDGELPEELCHHIREHLDGCGPCVAFTHTLKKTADLCRRLPAASMPPEVAADFQRFLAACLSQRTTP